MARQIIEIGGDFSQLPDSTMFSKIHKLENGDTILLHANLLPNNGLEFDIDALQQIYKAWVSLFPENNIIVDLGIDSIEIKKGV